MTGVVPAPVPTGTVPKKTPPLPVPPPPAPVAPPTPAPAGPPLPAGKYRSTQPYLFQPVPARLIPRRIVGGTDFLWDRYGPTHKFVDSHSGWLWTRLGGDWIDANRVRHGTAPWFSVPSNKAAVSATSVASYDTDVTLALRHVQVNSRWCAFLFKAKNAPRAMAGVGHPTHAAPYIAVTYRSGLQATLRCRIVASISTSSTGPNTTSTTSPLPLFIEFDRPNQEVASARLYFVLTEHWSGATPSIEGFLLDPPVNTDAVRAGLAAAAQPLDAGIENQPAVIGAHHYLDGHTLADFVHPGTQFEQNYGAERNYDPSIFGNGPADLNKLPHVGLGKWINTDSAWSLVNSQHRGEGFAPLAPGLGALKLHMPAHPNVRDGATVGYSGTPAGNGMILMPEPLFGRLDRIFVRYYFRLGSPYQPTKTNRYQVVNSPGSIDWTTHAGKFGICPDHSSETGGVSGSSGGGGGWQMRLSWYDCDAGKNGPSEGGIAPGFHLWDFNFKNPAGHRYGQGDGDISELWGQRGGAGGVLYAGQWYCIETELKLNTVMPNAPGYVADGELRAWIDGRLAYQRTGMVFRSLPRQQVAYNQGRLRNCRELGVRGLWLDWFHGGKTVATFDRSIFYTGLVWSKEYIGPMKM